MGTKNIQGLKKAVGDYQRANEGGHYSPIYGCLMYDKADKTVWTDEFCSMGHNSWNDYSSDTIVNLSRMMIERGIEINMKNVREFIEKEF